MADLREVQTPPNEEYEQDPAEVKITLTAACSDDLLLGALAACSRLTAQAVAESFGIDVETNRTLE